MTSGSAIPPDTKQRRAALDPQRSFIVQAPAGSGKTELLIQRYLRLLATVDEPEQIIAITFTRKAAAEVLERVTNSLDEARRGIKPEAPHKVVTHDLAAAVLEHADKQAWDLVTQTQRLRIETIDALNASLAARLPVLSGGIAGSQVAENAESAYTTAAQRTLTYFSESAPTLSAVLGRLMPEVDYSFAKLESMIAKMLGTRERWSEFLGTEDNSAQQKTEHALQLLRDDAAARVGLLIDTSTVNIIRELLEHSVNHLGRDIEYLGTTGSFAFWRAATEMLLTLDGKFRSRITTKEGFTPEHKEQKKLLASTIDQMAATEGLHDALLRLRIVPADSSIESDAKAIDALRELLRHAVAELRLYFSEHGVVDFSELAFAAQHALGEFDRPSDLLLALDRRIQHILVDEYQDTSVGQYRLLRLLTEGWEPDDGRTLFLVGDPMQSIYRFRNADMALFLRTRKFGVGAIDCESLNLTANFRSDIAVVDWVNTTFGKVFPQKDDLAGAVAAFHASTSMQDANSNSQVTCHAVDTNSLDDELAHVVDLIADENALNSNATIAVLVQSRTHLAGFQKKLRENGWNARAVEIDALFTEPFAQDLLALARALSHAEDRIAWLAVLRAPWCGLRWRELELLVTSPEIAEQGFSVWAALQDNEVLDRLGAEANTRIAPIVEEIRWAMQARMHLPFSQILDTLWRRLCGEIAAIEQPDEQSVSAFFNILDEALVDNDVDDIESLEKFFRKPVAKSSGGNAVIDIMTIHKAKGLEFDVVIVPGLNRSTRKDTRKLLDVLSTVTESGQEVSLFSGYRSVESALSKYIRNIESERNKAEQARLLYVATTRARSRLHLVWASTTDRAGAGSLLHTIGHAIEGQAQTISPQRGDLEKSGLIESRLRRFKAPLTNERLAPVRSTATAVKEPYDRPEFEWAGASAIHIGVVVHAWLQRICQRKPNEWSVAKIHQLRKDFERELSLLGVLPEEMERSADKVVLALCNFLEDPRGQWIAGAHADAASEVSLSRIEGNRIVWMRLDRTFIENGTRWIVDFKTGEHEGADEDAFLDAEIDRYRSQLEGYAHAVAEFDSRPIRLALYYPLMRAFRDWPASMR